MSAESLLAIQPCKNKAAWEVRPRKQLKLNLLDLAIILYTTKYQILVDTPHLLIVKKDYVQCTIYPSGRMLLDGVDDRNKGLDFALTILSYIPT
ncbi:MAG: hypothetical protein ACFFCQ_17565 [Promethearchaeota archaeon]